MATVQKTTFRRFNGIDWDTIYFASTADITVLGISSTVEKDETGFAYGDVLESTDSVAMLLSKVINRLATLETERIAALESGSGIETIDVSKLEGIIDRKNLPADVSGKGIEVADNDAKDALTAEDVNVGDIVKVTGGKIYLVTGEEPDDPDVENGPTHLTYMTLADDQSDVAWDRITGKPTTLAGYGITDAVNTSDTVNHGTKAEDDPEDFTSVNKVAMTNADGKLDFDITGDAATLGGQKPDYYATAAGLKATNDAIGDTETDGTIRKDIATLQTEMKNQDASWIKTGTINLARLPKAALAELHIITSEDDLATLTTEQVQLGDTVKIADQKDEAGNVTVPGGMFYVADESKLGTEDYKDAFVPYTASAASSVYWSGVMETPTTLAGYGITDAVNTSDLAKQGGTAAANKVAQANADGKLDFDITGDAATLGGHSADYFGTAEDLSDLSDAHDKTAETVAELVALVIGDTSGEPEDPDAPPAKTLVERVVNLETLMGDAPEDYDSDVMTDLAALKAGTAIEKIDVSKLDGVIDRKNLPSDVGGRIIEVTDMEAAFALEATQASTGDLVILDNGQVYGIKDGSKLNSADGYKLLVDVAGSSIKWSQVTDTPKTLNGYGITDAVNTSDVIEDGIYDEETNSSVAGKIVKIATDNKLHVDIAGDAATLGGQQPEYYASQATVDELSLRCPVLLNSVDDFANPKVGQLVIVPYVAPTAEPPEDVTPED